MARVIVANGWQGLSKVELLQKVEGMVAARASPEGSLGRADGGKWDWPAKAWVSKQVCRSGGGDTD